MFSFFGASKPSMAFVRMATAPQTEVKRGEKSCAGFVVLHFNTGPGERPSLSEQTTRQKRHIALAESLSFWVSRNI